MSLGGNINSLIARKEGKIKNADIRKKITR